MTPLNYAITQARLNVYTGVISTFYPSLCGETEETNQAKHSRPFQHPQQSPDFLFIILRLSAENFCASLPEIYGRWFTINHISAYICM